MYSPLSGSIHVIRSGVLWTLAGQVIQQVLRVFFSILLARLLSPRDFGLVGMATVFSGFAGLFVTLGFGQAIVQRKDLRPEHLGTTLTLSLCASIALLVAFWCSAGYIATVYGEPILKPILAMLALQFPLSALGVVHSALLSRAMRFKELALVDLYAFLAGSSAAVIAALCKLAVWSLVVNSLVYALVSTILLWRLSGWKPRLGIHRSCATELWSYSQPLVGFNSLFYWARNADNFLIGKYCGASELGAYNRAYQLMMLPVDYITKSVSAVVFPVLCKLQSEDYLLRTAVLKLHRIIALITFPLMTGLCILAEPFVIALFGEKWMAVVPLIQVLAWTGLGQSLGVQHLIYNTLGRTDMTFKIGGVNSALMIVSFVVGLRWGAFGVALSYTLTWWLVVFPLGWSVAARMVGLTLSDILTNLRGVFLCTAVMGGITWLVKTLLEGRTPPVVQLLISVMMAVFSYWTVVRVSRLQAYDDARRLLNQRGASG